MRKPDSTKPKGKPRGRYAKKETPVEQTQPAAAPEPGDEDLQAAVARQVAAKFAAMEAEPILEPGTVAHLRAGVGKLQDIQEMMDEPQRPAADVDAEIRAAMPEIQPPSVAESPKVAQQEVLAALVQQQQQPVTPRAPTTLPMPPRKRGESTQQYTERLVDVIVSAQMARRKLVLERRRLKQPIHDIPPVDVYQPTRNDDAAPPPDAKLKEGWWQQWIPTTDIRGEPDPTLAKVQGMRAWGYEVVTDEGGKPVQRRLGVLMQGPPERRAARAATLTPVGARKPREQEEQFLQQVEAINREHGRTVITAEDRSGKEQF